MNPIRLSRLARLALQQLVNRHGPVQLGDLLRIARFPRPLRTRELVAGLPFVHRAFVDVAGRSHARKPDFLKNFGDIHGR